MSTHHSTIEKLNMLGAALITATAAHGLLCLASLPGLSNAPAAGFLAAALKFAGITWSVAGVTAAGYAAWLGYSIINGRSLLRSQKAAQLTLILPLIGLTGGVTAFALLPIGGLAFYLFRSSAWQAAFADTAVLQAAMEPVEFGYAETERQDLAA
jgi:hypothetical protein